MMYGDAARLLARKLAVLPEAQMREQVMLEYLEQTDPDVAAPVLAEILVRGRSGGPPFDVALRSIFGVLGGELLAYDSQVAIYRAAKRGGHVALLQLLFSGPPSMATGRMGDPQRQQTLGHRKTLARRDRDPDVLARLLADPEPPVIRQLLLNPRLTEEDVVRLAARRPTDPEVQRVISGSSRWLRRYRVKRALVLNPNTPIELSIRLLGFLDATDLRLVRGSPTLAPRVLQAAELVESQRGRRAESDDRGALDDDDHGSHDGDDHGSHDGDDHGSP